MIFFFFMFLDEWKQYYYYYFFKRFKKKINILCVGNIDIFFFFHVSVPVKTMFKKTWGPVKKNKSWWKIMFSLVGTCENNILKKINKFHVSGPVKNFFLFMCWGEEKKKKKIMCREWVKILFLLLRPVKKNIFIHYKYIFLYIINIYTCCMS